MPQSLLQSFLFTYQHLSAYQEEPSLLNRFRTYRFHRNMQTKSELLDRLHPLQRHHLHDQVMQH